MIGDGFDEIKLNNKPEPSLVLPAVAAATAVFAAATLDAAAAVSASDATPPCKLVTKKSATTIQNA